MNTTKEEIKIAFKKHIGEVIRFRRRKAKLKQANLSTYLGISRTTVSKYETGRLDMPISQLPLISKYCGFKLWEYIVGYEGEKPNAVCKRMIRNASGAADVTPEIFETEWMQAEGAAFDEYIKKDEKKSELLSIASSVVDYMVEFDVDQDKVQSFVQTIELTLASDVKDRRRKRVMAYFKALTESFNNSAVLEMSRKDAIIKT